MNNLNKNVLLGILSCINVISVSGQLPSLGAAENFSVFTGVGAFNNTGVTTIMSDIGTNDGTITGFPPGVYFGQAHVEDATSASAALAVNDLYGDLAGRSCANTIGVGLGNGQVLTPGTYCTGAAATLSGNLILNGQNDLNSIFIIQINGALSTISPASVILINGASSCNVFWQINGMLTLMGNTDFKGTAVVQGAVDLLGTSFVEGRILVTSGAISMESNFISPCELSLPIQLISFEARLNSNEKSIDLNWQTASETNSSHFIIQKSIDGVTFNDLVKVTSIGNSRSMTNYSFIDLSQLCSKCYYRLQHFDTDGSFTYSYIRVVDAKITSLEMIVFPNPFSNEINIQLLSETDSKDLIFQLFDVNGKLVSTIDLTNNVSLMKNNDLSPGQYFYVLKNSEKVFKRGKLLSL